MSLAEAERFRWNPFDVTKIWPHAEYPLIPVGQLVLNRNPKSYFNEVEQIAFSPANMIPGIEPSPDKMLQGRLFSYTDTHRHRLGPNYVQLSVNAPKVSVVNTVRDGSANHDRTQDGAPNYFPNSFNGVVENKEVEPNSFSLTGDVQRYDSSGDENHCQVKTFWTKVLKPEERKRLVQNICGSLKQAENFIQERAVKNFTLVHPDFGRMVGEELKSGGATMNHFEGMTKPNFYHHDPKSNL